MPALSIDADLPFDSPDNTFDFGYPVLVTWRLRPGLRWRVRLAERWQVEEEE